MGLRILVADDETSLRTVIARVLSKDGHEVDQAASGEEALAKFRKDPFPLIISDIVMGEMSGLELLKEAKLLNPETLVVMMTSHASLDTATEAVRTGAYDYLIKPFDELATISAVVNRASEQIRLTSINQDLIKKQTIYTEELEEVNAKLKTMADRDGLTGLYNHRYFREAFEKEISRSERHGHTISLIFIDIDHFKRYNDTHGHLAGDEALRGLAGLIEERCRASSIAARYGGEEFVILVPETDKQGALAFGETLRRAVEEYPFEDPDGKPLGQLTLSLGISTYPEDGTDSQTLVNCADIALYQAKHEGRNRIVVWREQAVQTPQQESIEERR